MYTIQPKKMLIINILDILKKYTDENHTLSQKDIIDILEREYDMKADRKSIKRNLMNLIDFGYDIEYTEAARKIKNKNGEDEETSILSDFYLNREFSESELRLLIDSVIFAKHIPKNQCASLIKKLEGLSSVYFKSKFKHIKSMSDNMPVNKQLFYTIGIIDEAIANNKKISFHYNEYFTDFKLHPKLNKDGSIREYIINPYQLAAANGKYYLICNHDPYDAISNYKLNRITDAKILDEPRKPLQKVVDAQNGFDLPKHMAEHIYMYAGKSIHVEMRAKKNIVNEIIDWFGNDIKFMDENDDEVTAIVHVNENAMRRWAVQYSLYVRITSPQSLADAVKGDLKEALDNYNR